MEPLLFLLALAAFVGIAVYAMAGSGPPPTDPDTEPPSDFLPDITAATHEKLWKALK